MKYKALRRIDTKEFVHIQDYNGNLFMYTISSPDLLNETATIDSLKEYYNILYPDSDEQPYFDEYELVDIELKIIDNQ